jgi:hypothetical protein
VDEPTLENDPFQMDDYNSRKINDEDLLKEEEAEAAKASVMGNLESKSRAFLDKVFLFCFVLLC